MSSDPYAALGAYLTASEADALAAQFDSGQHAIRALAVVNPARRERVKQLLAAAGIGHTDPLLASQVLRAIAGARSVHREFAPVWTMPGNEARTGHLTSEFDRIVLAARQSVTCATYNFQDTSRMWTVLHDASQQAEVVVTLYVDATTADAAAVKHQIPKATVYRSALLPSGKRVVSHAKFVVVDHEIVLLTSANFSYSAENTNIELGLLIHDSGLAKTIEETMTGKCGSLYELA